VGFAPMSVSPFKWLSEQEGAWIIGQGSARAGGNSTPLGGSAQFGVMSNGGHWTFRLTPDPLYPVPPNGPWLPGTKLEFRTEWNGRILWNDCQIKAANPDGSYAITHGLSGSGWARDFYGGLGTGSECPTWPAAQLRAKTKETTEGNLKLVPHRSAAKVEVKTSTTNGGLPFEEIPWSLPSLWDHYLCISMDYAILGCTVSATIGDPIPGPNKCDDWQLPN